MYGPSFTGVESPESSPAFVASSNSSALSVRAANVTAASSISGTIFSELSSATLSRSVRLSAASSFSCHSAAVGVLAWLIYSPPRVLRRRVQQYLKAHPALLRFRVGEGVLVRWAQHEDVLLDDMDDDATVVHGDDVHYADEEEQIPLKPSPHRTRSGHITYGSLSK